MLYDLWWSRLLVSTRSRQQVRLSQTQSLLGYFVLFGSAGASGVSGCITPLVGPAPARCSALLGTQQVAHFRCDFKPPG
jgi:hypothetical protein